MHIRARAFIVRIPFLLLYYKRSGNTFHHRVLFIFYINLTFSKSLDIIFVSDATHKVREPLPLMIAIKLAQKRSMVKAYPSAFSFVDIFLKSGYGFVGPGIRHIIQL